MCPKFSVSCLRNSTLDPVFSHTCTDVLQPVPLKYTVISSTLNILLSSHCKAVVLNQNHVLRLSDLI